MDPPLSSHTQSPPPRPVTGAILQKHWRAWRRYCPSVYKWVKEGVRIPWKQTAPHARTCKQKLLTQQEVEWLDKEVHNMIQAGAIFHNDNKNVITSSIYTVFKKESPDRRPVINLRWVNEHVHSPHFKMTTLKDAKALITRNCWMAKIDLKDCFWQLPVHPKDRRTLSFKWKGIVYSFRGLPFGLSVSP